MHVWMSVRICVEQCISTNQAKMLELSKDTLNCSIFLSELLGIFPLNPIAWDFPLASALTCGCGRWFSVIGNSVSPSDSVYEILCFLCFLHQDILFRSLLGCSWDCWHQVSWLQVCRCHAAKPEGRLLSWSLGTAVNVFQSACLSPHLFSFYS